MRAVMESIFSIGYLVVIGILGIRILQNAEGRRQHLLFGVMALVLGLGDAFHLVPRILGLLTDTMEARVASLGFGTLVTSLTMTIFYVLLYHYWCERYQKPIKSKLTMLVYGLALCRIALCLFPQNAWLSPEAPLNWGIYRNIPFALLGAVIVVLFYREARHGDDPTFRYAWLAVLLSFLFYLPVVLWASAVPAVGMLMLPKTVCYVWLVVMGYKGVHGKAKDAKKKVRL